MIASAVPQQLAAADEPPRQTLARRGVEPSARGSLDSGRSCALDISRLENLHTRDRKTVAACPACRETGEDASGDHLFIYESGRWGCVKHPGPVGHDHRRRIFALVGVKSVDTRPASAKRGPSTPATVWPDPEKAARACTPKDFRFVACYRYGNGATARYENRDSKTFRQFHTEGDSWTVGAPSGQWVLYGVEALPATGCVYVVEGEKAQSAAVSIGLAATCSAGGSKAAAKSDWQPLAGRDVVLLPDNDAPGEAYARDVSAILANLVPPAHVRTVRLPGLPTGGDIVEFLAQRDAQAPDILKAEIEALAATAEIASPPGPMDGAAVLRENPPPHRPVLAGLFDCQSLVEVVGPSKTRKSFLVLMLAMLLASGRRAFGFDVPHAFSVCIADLELSLDDIRRRLWRMGRALAIGPEDIGDRLCILPLAGVENPRAVIESTAAGFDVLVCDPLYALCDGAETIENFREPLRWLRRLAVGRAACLFVHHDAKGTPGDREARDRGSGSGITGRAVDARIVLTPAAADPDHTVVMGFMCRSYMTPQPRAYTFMDDAFRESDLPAEPERQSDRRTRQSRPKLDRYREAALRILRTDGPMSPAVFKRRLRDDLNASKGDADDLVAKLCEKGGPAVRWREGGFATAWKIGTEEQSATSRLLPGKKQEEGEEG